jgi:hypothetical protein
LANTLSFIYLTGQVWVYIKIISQWWVWVFDKFTSAGSNYVYPGWYPAGVGRLFWHLLHTGGYPINTKSDPTQEQPQCPLFRNGGGRLILFN